MTQEVVPTSGNPNVYLMSVLEEFMKYGESHGVKNFPALHSLLWRELIYALERKCKFPGTYFPAGDARAGNAELEHVFFGFEFICDERADFRISLKPEIICLEIGDIFPKPADFDEAVAEAFKIASRIPGFFGY